MKNFDATRASRAPLYCHACGRLIAGGNWFARIKLGDGRAALCRPRCVERFLDCPARCVGASPEASSGEPEDTAQTQVARSLETAPANRERAVCKRPIATAAMRLVNA